MRGRMQAIVIAVVFILLSLLLPPLSVMSAAAVALVTLRKGPRDGIVILLGAGVAVGVLGQILFGSPGFVIAYALGFWLPVWIFSILLRESAQLGLTLEVALGLGLLAIIGIYLVSSDPASMWHERLQLVLQPLLKNPPQGIEIEQIEAGILAISHFMTGILVTGSIVSLVLAMLLGRWWQAVLFNPGGFRQEFLGLKSHSPVAYGILLILSLAGLSGGALGEGMQNAGILACFFYLTVGVSVLHVVISATSMSRWLLPVMYILMFFVPHVLLPVALVGFTDTWANWRGRFAAK
ncbi:MAG: hypothetical protein L0Y38_11430 [Methylococcaceae bacterium]|nr:hypothetical protein [Methylococcaceae bacterium]MCI0668458.1 hypothetical protein [Methylococcaceae bacterium]MCI0734412.1 hypothetical protein [Methylococcaceae bacterium]